MSDCLTISGEIDVTDLLNVLANNGVTCDASNCNGNDEYKIGIIDVMNVLCLYGSNVGVNTPIPCLDPEPL